MILDDLREFQEACDSFAVPEAIAPWVLSTEQITPPIFFTQDEKCVKSEGAIAQLVAPKRY